MSPRHHALLALAAIVIVSAVAPFHRLRVAPGETRAIVGQAKSFAPS